MKKITMITACIALTGCMSAVVQTKQIPLSAAQLQQIQDTARHDLKDPSSAQFRNIRRIETVREDGNATTVVCGEINGKNSFGAYVGFRTFKGNFNGNTFRLHGIGSNDDNWLYAATCPK